MRLNLTFLVSAIWFLLTLLPASANTTVRKPKPNLTEEETLLTVPGRIYYFDNDQLHCYNTQSGEDTHISDYYAGAWRTMKSWHDKDSDCVFLVENGGGNAVDFKTIYQLSNTNELKPLVTLTGLVGETDIDVNDDYIYLDGLVSETDPVNLPRVEKGMQLSDYFSKGMKPWRFTKNSFDLLKKPKVNFFKLTAPGVNVRVICEPKASRLGYYKPLPGYEEEGHYFQVEGNEPDPQIFTRSFIPWHPEEGTIFASSDSSCNPEEWTSILVEDLPYTVYISSKFMKQLETEALVSMNQIQEGDLKDRVYKLNLPNYPGMWLMIGGLPDCGEAPLYIGKEIDGMVIFKWRAGWPVCADEYGKRIHVDENGTVFYGEELTKNGYELDLSKINENDLNNLFKVTTPVSIALPIMVKFPGIGVKTFDVLDRLLE